MKNDSGVAETAAASEKPEPGADSQLHNYNVALTRLGDLFGDDDEATPPKREK